VKGELQSAFVKVTALLLGAIISGITVWGQEEAIATDGTTVSTVARVIVLEPSQSADGVASDTLTFRITGPTPQAINVEILDLVIDSSGERSILPLGSTAHTLDELVEIGSFVPRYVPDGTAQNFSVELTTNSLPNQVRFGGVRVSISGDSRISRGSTLDNVSGVFLTVLIIPPGFDGTLPLLGEATLGASVLSVKPVYVENLFERILPDLPRVINRGPVVLGVDFSNESSDPFFVSTEWSVSSDGDTLLASSTDQALLFAGQMTKDQINTAVDVPGSTRLVDVLPSFGVVHAKVVGEARLGRNVLDSTERSTSFLVLRWKEPFAIIVALALIVFLLRPRKVKPANDDIPPTGVASGVH